MKFALLAKQAEKLLVDNSPLVLSGVAIVGTAATVVLALKAGRNSDTMVANEISRRTVMNEPLDMTRWDVAKASWTAYLPVAASVGVTVACIVCSHRITTKRAAALAAAYSLGEKRFKEYQDKVVEKFTPAKEQKVRDEISQEKVTANPPKDNQIIVTGNGEVLMYDEPVGRYFHSTVDKVREIMNDINHEVNEVGYATLQDFYAALGLPPTPYSEELGWKNDEPLLDVRFSAVMTDDKRACIAMTYTYEPIRHDTKGHTEDPPF